MHIAVLAAPDSWYFRDLQRAAAGVHELTSVSYGRLAVSMRGGEVAIHSGRTRLDRLGAVLVRSMPPGTLEQVVFRMDALARLEAAGVAVINSAKAIETAVDKYLATARLQAEGLLVPATAVCQTATQAAVAFEELGGIELQKNATLLANVELGGVPDRLHPLLQPGADARILNVHVLHADLAAVGGAEDVDQGAERGVVGIRQRVV
jgi:hypothetical protein